VQLIDKKSFKKLNKQKEMRDPAGCGLTWPPEAREEEGRERARD
jgi:hypothetical protein